MSLQDTITTSDGSETGSQSGIGDPDSGLQGFEINRKFFNSLDYILSHSQQQTKYASICLCLLDLQSQLVA